MAGSSKGQAAKAGADREATRRVVLEKVGVVVIPRELEGKPVEEVLNRIKPLLAEAGATYLRLIASAPTSTGTHERELEPHE